MVFIKLLGDPLLRGPDGPITGRAAYRRRMALLAILAVARGRPVGRERLIGLLWPEHPADAARHTLSESLYVLRKELGDGLFFSVGDEVGLNPDAAESDVDRFEGALEAGLAEAAVRAYEGPFLDGFYVSNALEFERWVDGERDRLGRAYASALETLATDAETRGSPLEAVEWWRRLAAHDPYSSRAALRLARAREAAGERAAALRGVSAHAALLRDELEVELDDELAAFVERLQAEPARVRAPTAPLRPGLDAERELSGSRPSPVENDAKPAVSGIPAPVTEEPASSVDPAPTPPPFEETAVPPSPPSAPPGWRRGRLAAALAGAAAVVALGAGVAFSLGGGAAPAPEPRYDPRRIAVLYFDDYSAGGELGYLANGLTEMLIHELSQVEALDVVSRNGVKRYRERSVPFDSLAADLRAGSVVEGSVQRSAGRVRVTVQLIDANTQAHLDSRVVERPVGDLFAVQDAVAGEVAAFLRRRVGREVERSELRRGTDDPRALELVLRAAAAREDARQMARSTHPRDVEAALRALASADTLLARAAARDRRWAEPPVQRGWGEVERARLLRGPAQVRTLEAALARAEEGLRLEPGSVDARELRGTALWLRVFAAPDEARGRPWLAQGERDLRAVVAAAPHRASGWSTLSQLLRLGGDLAEAEVAARRAREEDAWLDVPEVGVDRLYRAAFAFADFPRARHWCAEGRRRFPGDYRFHECELALLARDPAVTPRPDSAWRLVAGADAVDPPATARTAGRPYSPVFRRMMAAAVLARAGLGDSARAVSARARRGVEGDADLLASYLWDEAYLQLLLGDRRRAAALVDSFVMARPTLAGYAAREPAFQGLPRP